MAEKVLLRNGLIVDGTGKKPYNGSVILDGDKIEAVVAGDVASFDGKVYDCTGKVIMPGIIDSHTHQDRYVDFKDPLPFFIPFLRQGVTSTIAGNCGSSEAVYAEGTPYRSPRDPYDHVYYDADFSQLDYWLDWLKGRTPFNMATLIGHGAVRGSLTGYTNQAPLTAEEIEKMKNIMRQSMAQGACGVSLGLMYEPGRYGTTEEFTACAEVCAEYNKPLSLHPRAMSRVSGAYKTFDESHLIKAFDEIFDICKKVGCKFQYSHALFVGDTSWGDVDIFLDRVDKAHAEGYDIMFDNYSPTYGASAITVIAPAWLLAMTKEEMLKPETIAKLKEYFGFLLPKIGFGLPDVRISKSNCEPLKKYEGWYIPEIAKDMGVDPEYAYAWCIAVSERKAQVLQYKYTTNEINQRLAKRSDMFFMSDAWYLRDTKVQNPALFGNFTRFLVWTREGKLNSLEDTVRKMSGAVADRYDLRNVGYLRDGYNADVTVLDYDNVVDRMDDFECSSGTSLVFINGVKVLENDTVDEKALATMPGKPWKAEVTKK